MTIEYTRVMVWVDEKLYEGREYDASGWSLRSRKFNLVLIFRDLRKSKKRYRVTVDKVYR